MATEVIHTIGSTGDYSSLAAWEAAQQRNLVSADEIAVAEILDEFPSGCPASYSNGLYISGWTMDATRYAIIRPTAGAEYDPISDTGITLVSHASDLLYGIIVANSHRVYINDVKFSFNNANSITYSWGDLYQFTNCTFDGNVKSKGFTANSYFTNCLLISRYFTASEADNFGSANLNRCTVILPSGFGGWNGDIACHSCVCNDVVVYNENTKTTYNSYYSCSGDYNAQNNNGSAAPPGANSFSTITTGDFNNYASDDFTPSASSQLIGNGTSGGTIGYADYVSGGITQVMGVVSESDISLAFSVTKILPLSQSTETEVSAAVTVEKTQAIGVSTESDQAQSLAAAKYKTIAQALENDAALAVGSSVAVVLTLATEADAAQSLSASKSAAVGQANEADISQPFGNIAVIPLSPANENDQAQGLVASKLAALGLASETDIAQLFATGQARVIAPASEADAAQAFAGLKNALLGLASEADSAQALQAGKSALIGQVSETEQSLSLSALKEFVLNPASETDIAQALSGPIQVAIGVASETDLALDFVTGISFVDGNIHVLTASGRRFVLQANSRAFTMEAVH